jgi:uncharacterized protein YndB with AHSA1/START domain
VTDTGELEVSVHIAARPETVFPYFTDPALYVTWMGSRAELEPRPGGIYRVIMGNGVEASGEFLEVDPPRRLVFSWGWNHDQAVAAGSTRVEVTFTEEDGGTRVVLRHAGLPDGEQEAHHRAGWEAYLSRLSLSATGRDPGPDPND